MVGGTRGADYVYILFDGFLTNVRHLPGAKLIAKEMWGSSRRREIYRIPKSMLINKPIMHVNFSHSGSISLELCMVNERGVDCYPCSHCEEICRRYASKFRIIGGERQLAEFYINFMRKLVNEIKSIAEKANTEEIFFAGHAQRLEEALNDPQLSLFTTMVLNTWQGRARSLREKISHIAELWVLAKIIEAIDGETIALYYLYFKHGNLVINFGRAWWIEFTKNHPFAYIKSRATGKEYTFYYQSSIYPHTISGHLIPDIAVFKGVIDKPLGWGRLHKLSGYPLLVVEVKSGLETSEWRKPEYILKQLEAYKEHLEPEHIALTVLTQLEDPALKAKLEMLGVDLFENLLSSKIQAEFTHYVRSALR